MRKVAIVIASRYGQTRKIAERMAKRLEVAGRASGIYNVEKEAPNLEDCDGCIIGAPVYAEKFPSKLLNWTRSRVDQLNKMQTGLYTVSLNSADAHKEARVADRHLIETFLSSTGLKPNHSASLAGSLNYPKYNFLLKWIMKRISSKHGGPTDTGREYELTDWKEVDEFVRNLIYEDSVQLEVQGRITLR